MDLIVKSTQAWRTNSQHSTLRTTQESLVTLPAPSYIVLGPCSLGFQGIMGLRGKLSQHYFEHQQQMSGKYPEFTSQLSQTPVRSWPDVM